MLVYVFSRLIDNEWREGSYRKRFRDSPHARCRAAPGRRTCRRRDHAWARLGLFPSQYRRVKDPQKRVRKGKFLRTLLLLLASGLAGALGLGLLRHGCGKV